MVDWESVFVELNPIIDINLCLCDKLSSIIITTINFYL